MSDDGRFGFFSFVFVEEFSSARKGNLIDVLVDFVFGHANAPISDSQCFVGLVSNDFNGRISIYRIDFAQFSERNSLLGSIYCV